MPSWNWGESQSEDGVVHQSTANTDHNDAGTLKQGYDYANFSEITPDPGSCWPLHEDGGSTAYNVAGANNGTVNGATVGQTGLLNSSAYSFDGTDDIVTVSTSALTSTAPLTYVAWANVQSSGPILQYSRDRFQIGYENYGANGYEVRFWNGSNQELATTGETTTGSWVFVAGTYDGSTLTAYAGDGSASLTSGTHSTSQSINQNSTDDSGFGGNTNDNFYIGANIAGGRTYSSVLSEADLQTLYDVVNTQGTWTGTAKPL